MSDYSDGSGQIARRPRVNDGPPPVSGVVAIVLAVIAVVAGYFILRSITDDGQTAGITNPGGVDAPAVGSGGASSTAPTSDQTVGTLAPINTEPVGLPTTGASVIVANANGQGGSAGQATRVLENSANFELADPTDATESTPDLDASAIYYDPTNAAAQAVANSLNVVLGGVLAVNEMPDPVPVQEGDLKGAGVLLMLGKDFADMAPSDLDLTQLAPADAAATPSTDPAGGAPPSSTTAP